MSFLSVCLATVTLLVRGGKQTQQEASSTHPHTLALRHLQSLREQTNKQTITQPHQQTTTGSTISDTTIGVTTATAHTWCGSQT